MDSELSPVNDITEIKQSIYHMQDWMQKHEVEDHTRHEENLQRFKALEKTMGNVANKADTAEILKAIKAVHLGSGVIKIGWKTFKTIGVVGGSLVAIVAFWKFIALWILSLILKSN